MSIILQLIPSGTLIEALGDDVALDFGLTIVASGTGFLRETMNELIDKSLTRINRNIESNFLIIQGDITPLPSQSVVDLIILQTECLLSIRSNEIARVNPSIKKVRLEEIELEFSDVDTLRSKDINSKFSFCAELEKVLLQYRVNIIGAGISGEIIWDGNTRRFEDVDHDGQHRHRHFNPLPDAGTNPNNDSVDGIGRDC